MIPWRLLFITVKTPEVPENGIYISKMEHKLMTAERLKVSAR
jgi:hypothetical protein